MSGIARLLDKRPQLSVRYVTPEIIHQAVAGPAASRASLDGRIEWHLSPDQSQLLEVTDAADIVVAVTAEPVAYERALLCRALARGAATLVAGAPHYDFLPPDVAPRLTPGRSLGEAFFVTIDTLLDDAKLLEGLKQSAKRWVCRCSDAASIAIEVQAALERARTAGSAPSRPAEVTWALFRSGVYRNCVPSNASDRARSLIIDRLTAVAPRVAGLAAHREG